MSFYIKKYILRSAAMIFGIAFFVFLVFFIVALFYDVQQDDILVSFQVLGIGAVVFAVSLIPIVRFHNMIRMQEAMFDIRFQANDATPLHRHSLVYLSKDWLIVAGRYAFYRDFIRNKRIMIQVQKTSFGNNYFIKIDGINDRSYRFHADSSSSAKQMKAWSKIETEHLECS